MQSSKSIAVGAVTSRLERACPAGPKEKLDSTVISQPAIYVASLAALEKLRQDSGEVTFPSHGNASQICTSLSLTLGSCLSARTTAMGNIFYGLEGSLRERAVCRRSSARQMWQQASAWANTLP